MHHSSLPCDASWECKGVCTHSLFTTLKAASTMWNIYWDIRPVKRNIKVISAQHLYQFMLPLIIVRCKHGNIVQTNRTNATFVRFDFNVAFYWTNVPVNVWHSAAWDCYNSYHNWFASKKGIGIHSRLCTNPYNSIMPCDNLFKT